MQSHSISLVWRVLLAPLIALVAFANGVQAQTYKLRELHHFSGAPNDGDDPSSGVRFDTAGNLYGTTDAGGAFNGGTIYKIETDGTESILHSFALSPTGHQPVHPNGLVIDPATGDIYGTTEGDGYDDHAGGAGQIYKLTIDGTFTVLHNFDTANDGVFPSHLLRDPPGNLYGVTLFGAEGVGSGEGAVFEYSADGIFTVLHRFDDTADSYGPPGPGGVVRDEAGNLYGVRVSSNATRDCGILYKLAPDGAFTVLYSFTGGADGCAPQSVVSDPTGNLYGMTSSDGTYGDGTVFKLNSDGTFRTLYSFLGTHYVNANALLLVGGTLYGTTYNTEDHYPGVVFKISPDGTHTTLLNITGGNGDYPVGRLTLKSGRLYGATTSGGTSGNGTIFTVGVATQ